MAVVVQNPVARNSVNSKSRSWSNPIQKQLRIIQFSDGDLKKVTIVNIILSLDYIRAFTK